MYSLLMGGLSASSGPRLRLLGGLRPHQAAWRASRRNWLATPTFYDDVHVHTHDDAEVRVFRVPPSYNSVDGMLCKAL